MANKSRKAKGAANEPSGAQVRSSALLAALRESMKECEDERRIFKKMGDKKHEMFWEGRREGVQDAILIVTGVEMIKAANGEFRNGEQKP